MGTSSKLHEGFIKKHDKIIEHFFSRNPKYWPLFSDPQVQKILEFRKIHCPAPARPMQYPGYEKLGHDILNRQVVPNSPNFTNIDPLLTFASALSKNWEDPASVENVVSTPSDPALYGSFLGIVGNANLVHREYSESASDLEFLVIRQIASLIGWDNSRATGIFTQGGTFCNQYGYLLGIRKSLPEAKHYGMGYTHEYRFMNSMGGHYSNTTNLSLLGINLKEKTLRIQVEENNNINLEDFSLQLESCFRLNCKVPTIMLTMGTTDTFGIDQVESVYRERNRLAEKYQIEPLPHIHVDAAVGWPMIFFLDYDFQGNPLEINEETLAGIQKNKEKFEALHFADSFTVDFQKWGYVPYTSSLVMIKNKDDLKALENDPENFSYFNKETQGHTHLSSTIECSRGAAGVFGAYAGLQHLGKEGYQILLAGCLQNANYFREKMKVHKHIKLLSSENQGPSIGFRIYNPQLGIDAEEAFHREYQYIEEQTYWEFIKQNSQWHENHFKARDLKGLYSNWVKSIAHSTFDERGHYLAIPGEKVVFMNPHTKRQNIDTFIANVKPN